MPLPMPLSVNKLLILSQFDRDWTTRIGCLKNLKNLKSVLKRPKTG